MIVSVMPPIIDLCLYLCQYFCHFFVSVRPHTFTDVPFDILLKCIPRTYIYITTTIYILLLYELLSSVRVSLFTRAAQRFCEWIFTPEDTVHL